MRIVHFTDPGCPWAFSAEPLRLRLDWTFGDQLEWDTRMIVLARSGDEYARKGFTPDKLAAGLRMIQGRYGMPIDVSERARMAGTERACRAVVAARLNAAELEQRLLRELRIQAMSGALLDDDATIDAAAHAAGVDPDELREWAKSDQVHESLERDRAMARDPRAAAFALDHKLAASENGGRRYTAPSMEFHHDDRVLVAPGMQPWECYDALVANLAPALDRRSPAESVDEVLEWAGFPLATAEVAMLMDSSIDAAREQLIAAGAAFDAVGLDGYWQ